MEIRYNNPGLAGWGGGGKILYDDSLSFASLSFSHLELKMLGQEKEDEWGVERRGDGAQDPPASVVGGCFRHLMCQVL